MPTDRGQLTVKTSKGRRHRFLRGMITHDLVQRGLDFSRAFKTAAAVREALREEYAESSKEGLEWSDRERSAERKRQEAAELAGEDYEPLGDNPVRNAVLGHEARYPKERLREIEAAEVAIRAEAEAARLAALQGPEYAVQALLGGDVDEAIDTLQALIDEGYDGTLVSNDVGGSVYFELQIGPYPTVDAAERVSKSMQDIHGLEPFVVVVSEEAAEEP